MYIGLQTKHPLFLSDFNVTWILDLFSKNTQKSIFMKIRLMGATLFHADRQDEATSRF